ncbi:MAG: HesA/MoeB/ThiF family protein [Promethearchaeia archaeon]
MNLTEEQIERYSRQIVLKEVGGKGQEKLLDSTVTILGLGALGSPTAYYLAAAGIGRLRLIDFDNVELSNLHRQILHSTRNIDKKKTSSAYERLKQINPDCEIELVEKRITPNNVKGIITNSDFLIEGSDNLPTKMLINDACINLGIPFTIAGVLRFHGQILTVVPEEKTTCYRCLFGGNEESSQAMSCSRAGVIGLIPGVMGCFESMEAIKYILDMGDLITNRILYVDLLKMSFNFIDVHRNKGCEACGDKPKHLISNYDYGFDKLCL